MPVIIPPNLLANLAAAVTWWQVVLALIAIAVYILTMSSIHHCRGFFYANKEGRKTIILMLVNLGSNPAEIVSLPVSKPRFVSKLESGSKSTSNQRKSLKF